MPTYEYRCPACQHEFEKLQKMSEEPVAACPECGAAAERLLSGGAGLLFKGSGFYITDYRSDSYKKAASSEKGSGGEKKSGDKGTSGSSSGGSSASKSE
jgi:putative FmdB family regulatory protein